MLVRRIEGSNLTCKTVALQVNSGLKAVELHYTSIKKPCAKVGLFPNKTCVKHLSQYIHLHVFVSDFLHNIFINRTKCYKVKMATLNQRVNFSTLVKEFKEILWHGINPFLIVSTISIECKEIVEVSRK